MECILCLEKPNESIDLFGETGTRLEIVTIISKHFWLEPKKEDYLNSTVICLPCWTSLESFHKFYGDVEKAHFSYEKIKAMVIENDEVEEEEANSSDYRLDDLNDILYPGIKVELNEESNSERVEQKTEDENMKCPINILVKLDKIDFEADEEFSDSEIPLSKLTKQIQKEKTIHKANSSPKSIEEGKNTEEEKSHILNGKWLAKCFAEETTIKPISHKELDMFIKLNMDLTCERCRIPMTDFSSLQEHFKKMHFGKAFVTCCDKKFTLRSRLVDHILGHKLPEYFSCVVCSKVLSCRQNLRKHMIVHDKKYVFQCEKCEKMFYRKQLLDRHMDTHVLDRKFKCDECDKLFTSKFSLGQHIYGVHKGGYKKICEQCGKVSRDQEAFVRHKLEHTNQPKPFVECPKCGIKLVDKNGLRKHLQMQHPDDPSEHICNDCGIVTNSIFALRRHVTFMHKRKRDHKCPMCDKAFKRALTLKPSENHINLNLVCCPCWKSLQSFHKFYESIEIAHCSLGEIKRDYDDNLHIEANSIDYRFDENNVLYPGIKNEYKNESNAKETELDTKDNVSYPQEDEIKSDQADFYTDNHFDSELLPNLTKELKEEEEENEECTDVESEMKSVETSKNRADVEIHIKEGKWLATCFGEETTTNSIKHEELDKFIKLNIELTCEMCRIPMKDFSTLQAHFKEAHTIKPFVTCCEKKIELRCRLVDHILLHKLPNYFTCVICSRVLSCRLNLRKHMTVHDKKQIYSCDKCEKTFYRKDVLNRHVLDIHTLGRSFKCEECDKLFASKCSLYTHIYGVHKGRYKKICEQCGKVSCDQETFLRHQLIHTNQPKPLFDCPKCSIKLSSKHGLRHHIKHQHPNAADNREHVCNVCGTISKTELGLKRHIKFMHVYKRDHKCTMCDKAFKRAQTLKTKDQEKNRKLSNIIKLYGHWTAMD